MKPFTLDESRLGYRPTFPEEDALRAKMRREAFDLVEAAKSAGARDTVESAAAG